MDYDLLGLSGRDIYMDTCITFEADMVHKFFQRCNDAVHFIMKKNGLRLLGTLMTTSDLASHLIQRHHLTAYMGFCKN